MTKWKWIPIIILTVIISPLIFFVGICGGGGGPIEVVKAVFGDLKDWIYPI